MSRAVEEAVEGEEGEVDTADDEKDGRLLTDDDTELAVGTTGDRD